MKVYHIGSSSFGATERINTLMRNNPKLLLVDVRKKPKSMKPGFNDDELSVLYGKRYRQAGAMLGNKNFATYKSGAPIEIVDLAGGVAVLIDFLQRGYDLLLLCQCTHEGCHRYIILRELKRLLPDVEIFHSNETAQSLDVQPAYKCLSIRPPYAQWIALHDRFVEAGVPPKTIENREWKTAYRGPVLLHASKHFEEDALWHWSHRIPNLSDAVPLDKSRYELGKIVGIADLVDIIEDSEDPWFCGTYGWVFANARPLRCPVAYRGALRLFDVPAELVANMIPDIQRVA